MRSTANNARAVLFVLMVCVVSSHATWAKTKKPTSGPNGREAYLARLQQDAGTPVDSRTPGSLWSPDGSLSALATDYKASRLHDTVIIQVMEQTSATSTGDVSGDRQTTLNSAITGLAAHVSTSGVNPILNAESAHKLKGSGQTSAASSIRSNLSAQVIAVLPNGLLVVEGHRLISMNNQHESMTVRGVIRPGDISSVNTIPSTALANLEIELKGKGVVSDFTRPPNPFVKVLMWFLGF